MWENNNGTLNACQCHCQDANSKRCRNGGQILVGHRGVNEPLPGVLYLISFVGLFGAKANNTGIFAGINSVERVRVQYIPLPGGALDVCS